MELHIRNISKTYPGGVRALHNVTLTMPAGVYGLLGPAGAGKSTLMRILAAEEEADGGSAALGDIDLLGRQEGRRGVLAYLAQPRAARPKVSVETLLDHFALTRPQLVLVDGHTAGLDPADRSRFLQLVTKAGKSSVVILCTRNVADVSEVCTRMAVIHGGCIVLEGDPQCAAGELHGRIWTREIAREALPRVEREYAVISTRVVAGRTVVRVYSNVAPAVGFERTQPELEDAYLSALAGHIGVGSPKRDALGVG